MSGTTILTDGFGVPGSDNVSTVLTEGWEGSTIGAGLNPSGVSGYGPALSDIGVDAFERIQLEASALTTRHFLSLRRSMNMVLTRWANGGINLWKVELDTFPLLQGVANYPIDHSVVNVLDTYRREVPMSQAVTIAPSFSTTSGSAIVTISQTNSGAIVGNFVGIIVPVTVGGLTISGYYVVQALVTGGFTITASSVATSTVVNGGTVASGTTTQIAQQNPNGTFTDILLTPFSRNDYAATPDKMQPGPPTTYWFDRVINPSLTLWPVPDGFTPYMLGYYVCRQVQDANPQMGQAGEIPYRFIEAFTAAVAAHLAMKWAPARFPALQTYASETWQEAASEDHEKVTTYLAPDFGGYLR